MDVAELRSRIVAGTVLGAPGVFANALVHRTLRSRLEAGSSMLMLFEGAPGGDPTDCARAVMDAKGEPDQILRVVRTFAVPDAARQLATRRVYRLDGDLWRRHSTFASVRVAIGLAADLIWMSYADGILAAREAAPVASLRTDLHAFAVCLYDWAVVDYPALALAVGAAFRPIAGARPLWGGLAEHLEMVVAPHLGGPFVSESDRNLVRAEAEAATYDITDRLARGGVPPFFTAPALTGLLLDRFVRAFPYLRLDGRDPVGQFESAASRLVFETLVHGRVDDRVLEALDHLHGALQDQRQWMT